MPKKKETKANEKPKINDNTEKQEKADQKLTWVQILLLLGKPLWDDELKKWRVLSGYQSILGNRNNKMFFEVTFTDTPYWENFIEKQLYAEIPKKNTDAESVKKS